MNEIWILGATGRTGRGVAAALAADDTTLVLVGRNAKRLDEMARGFGARARSVVARTLEETVAVVASSNARVVYNTIGPFTQTALPIAQACPPGTHYVDLSNELYSVLDVLGLHERAVANKQCLVTAAGFGVLGTESVVLRLCEGRTPAARVRVATAPRLDDGGVVGEALAATLIETAAIGGKSYRGGKLVRSRAGGDFEHVKLPDGASFPSAAGPLGDLVAAQRASGAADVVAASSEVPGSFLARLLLPIVSWLVSFRPIGNFAKRQLARVEGPPMQREHTWAQARVEWTDGTVREGFFRTGDAMAFTTKSVTAVVSRLARGEGKPGAYTPGALFGYQLAEQCGAELIVVEGRTR